MQNEASMRELATKLQARHEEEIDNFRNQKESIACELYAERSKVIELERSLQARFAETPELVADEGDEELLNWEPCIANGSSVCSEDLHGGMSVQLKGLVAKPELNGRWGSLIKFDVERDQWQVDLGVVWGIKLLRTCNLLADASHFQACR